MSTLLSASPGAFAEVAMAVAGALALLGIGGLMAGLLQKLRAKRLARPPRQATGSVAARGAELAVQRRSVWVEGRVRCKTPLKSPVTGTPCLFYQVEVRGRVDAHGVRRARTYVDHRAAARFFVDDGSGPLAVAADQGGDFDGLVQTYAGRAHAPRAARGDGLGSARRALTFGGFVFSGPEVGLSEVVTCTEHVLKRVDRLSALGALGPDRKLRAATRRPLLLSTRPRPRGSDRSLRVARRLLIAGTASAGLGLMVGLLALL